MRLSRIHPLLDAITARVLGHQTENGQKTPTPHEEIPVAVVSGQPSHPAARAVPDAVPEAARALPVLWDQGELPHVGSEVPAWGSGMAILVEPAQSEERHVVGDVGKAPEGVPAPDAQNHPRHLTTPAGQQSYAPERC